MKQSMISSVVVFGEALVDEFPEQKIIGGAPFNVARTLAHFGCTPLMLSRIGQDGAGELIRAEWQRCGLAETGLQLDTSHSSGRVLVTQENADDASSHRFEILPDQAYDYIEMASAQAAVAAFCQNQPAGLMYFGSLAQRSPTSRLTLQGLLKDSARLRYLDLNLRDGQVLASTIDASLRLADIVKLNEDELLFLLAQYAGDLGSQGASATLDLMAVRASWTPLIHTLMQLFDLQAMIVTLGARGYAYFDVQGRHFSADESGSPIHVVDTVGGGDAFSAVFLTGMIHGWPLETALRRAHAFATAVCGIRGAVSADAGFYQDWMQRWAAEEQAQNKEMQ